MLFNIISSSDNIIVNLLTFLFLFGALIISLSIHEFAHAYSAEKLGDPTAKYLGRVTLNPLAHLDPWGTLLLAFAGFGWGKPVPFDPSYFKNPKRDSALVSFAGPASNFILAIIFALVINFAPASLLQFPSLDFSLGNFFWLLVLYNLYLGFFNLIPVHPLDGFKVVNGFLPYRLSIQWMQLAPYGFIILVMLLFTNFVSVILDPLVSLSLNLLGLGF